MGVMRLLEAAARRAGARVFVIAGAHARDEARLLGLQQGIVSVVTPRAANVLLFVGELDPDLVAPALVVHDALPPPRATVWWRMGAEDALVAENFPGAVIVDGDDPGPVLRRVHGELITGERDGEPALLPDIEPAQWRGVGPYGQGGTGMTGGTPYGRPMAERAEDRDGLKLDQLSFRVGPFFGPFPPGLVLDVTLQGDVIQKASVENVGGDTRPEGTSIFDRGLHGPVPIVDLEMARARSHLLWLTDALRAAGAASLAQRVLQVAREVAPGDGAVVAAVERMLARRGVFRWSLRGIGTVGTDALEHVDGPVARASGVSLDARSADPSYRRLGFTPVVQHSGDAAARWIQRLREASQALDLAGRAGSARTGDIVESPHGSVGNGRAPGRELAHLVPALVEGMEWGDAVTTIVSLDLDTSRTNALESAGALR